MQRSSQIVTTNVGYHHPTLLQPEGLSLGSLSPNQTFSKLDRFYQLFYQWKELNYQQKPPQLKSLNYVNNQFEFLTTAS